MLLALLYVREGIKGLLRSPWWPRRLTGKSHDLIHPPVPCPTMFCCARAGQQLPPGHPLT
jgi:hypothetical protein